MDKKSIKSYLASRVLYQDRKGKNKEIKVLENFLKRMKIKNYYIEVSESPDFFIKFNSGEIIGCELTFFYNDVLGNHGSEEKRFFEQWRPFSNRLLEQLKNNDTNNEKVYGAIHFKCPSYTNLDDINENVFIDEIINIVNKNRSEIVSKESLTLYNKDFDSFPLFRDNVKKLYLKYFEQENNLFWWCAHLQSGVVKDSVDRVVEIVNNKNDKSLKYKWGNVSYKWLIIFAEALGLNDVAWIKCDPELNHRCKSMQFQAVYLWEQFNEDIIELFPTYRLIRDGRAKILNIKWFPDFIKNNLS